MNLEQMQSFLTLAKLLNFTDAANALYISQPTLSRHIALLEEALGYKLFARNKRNVTLTMAGEKLYKELNSLYQQINQAVENARLYDQKYDRVEGDLSIGCMGSVNVDLFLPAIMRKFAALYPNIRITLERDGFKDLREKLTGKQLDIVFTYRYELEGMQQIAQHTLYKSQPGFYVPSDMAPSGGKTTINELRDKRFNVISLDESPGGYGILKKVCKDNGFSPIVVKYCKDMETLLMYLESGLPAVALLDSSLRIYKKKHFRFIPAPEAGDVFWICAAWRKDNPKEALSLFLKQMKDNS